MREPQLIFFDESADCSRRGVDTGIVFLDFETFQFPERAWNDFVVIVVRWWLSALTTFIADDAAEAELRFMDGPFLVLVQRESGDEVRIRCIDTARARELFVGRGSAMDLLRSTLDVAVRVLRICGQLGWQSEDVDILESCAIAADKMSKRH